MTNTAIVGMRLPDATMTLQRFDLNTQSGENLLPPTKATIGFTSVSGDKLFFVSSLKGNDDIYSLDLNTKAINKLTAGQTGFYYPSVSGNQVIYSAFTANGYRLRTENIDVLKGEVIQPSDFTAAVDPVPVATGRDI
jgi:Tol biopolymer transport system component